MKKRIAKIGSGFFDNIAATAVMGLATSITFLNLITAFFVSIRSFRTKG